MRFAGLVADPVRPQQDLQARLKRQNADQPRILVDPDRPGSRNRRMFLNQSLNDARGEQHGVDIVRQRRAVMAMTVDPDDGIAHMKSVKRHEIMMPGPRGPALTSIKWPTSCEGNPGRGHAVTAPDFQTLAGRAFLPST